MSWVDRLKICVFDPRWTLAIKLADKPMVCKMMVNGLIVEVREAPRELQEEAVRRGLISYLPEEPGECVMMIVCPAQR